MFSSLDAHKAVQEYSRRDNTLRYAHVPVASSEDSLAAIVARYNKVGVRIHAWSSHPYGFDIYYTHETVWSVESGSYVADTRAQSFKPEFVYDLPHEGDE